MRTELPYQFATSDVQSDADVVAFLTSYTGTQAPDAIPVLTTMGDLRRLAAILAIEAEAAALDVERLTRAYDTVAEDWSSGEAGFIDMLAAEYARLAEPKRHERTIAEIVVRSETDSSHIREIEASDPNEGRENRAPWQGGPQ